MSVIVPLELTGLTKVFPTPAGPFVAVRDVNLRVQRSEFICIVGHSGCGKSTVLSIIAGLQQATHGGVVIKGRQTIEPGDDRAVVFQTPCLLPWLTSRENVLLAVKQKFRLWAIEGDEKVKEILSFSQADSGVVITPDITLFKELKLRLLNGTHTFNCALAFLSGFDITREAVTDTRFGQFAKKLMHAEIAPAIPYTIPEKQKTDFANSVFERFCNPFIDHQWQSITVQVTSKMKMRNLPLLLQHYKLTDNPPLHMAAGFAGFLLYMKVTRKEGKKYFGERNGPDGNREEYEIKDDSAAYFYTLWNNTAVTDLAEKVLADDALWNVNLAKLPGFTKTVQELLTDFMTMGVLPVLSKLETKKVIA